MTRPRAHWPSGPLAGDAHRVPAPRCLALALVLAACGPPPQQPAAAGPGAPSVSSDTAQKTGPQEPDPSNLSDTTCPEVHDDLGGLDWIPRDVRLAAVLDLDAPGLEGAAGELARAATTTPGLPIVAGLGLGQLDIQLRIVRAQLGAAGLTPRELALLHAADGTVVWVFRVRCDLDVLKAALARAFHVRVRATAAGPLAEPAPGSAFPHDIIFLADDRLALAPAGAGGRVRRWIEGPGLVPELDPPGREETPAHTLAGLDAPIRVVLAGRGLLVGDAPQSPRTLRAWPDRVVVDTPETAP